MLGVGDGVTDDLAGRTKVTERSWHGRLRMTTYVLQEDLENTTSLFIDQTRNTLDTTTTSETTDGGLCDT